MASATGVTPDPAKGGPAAAAGASHAAVGSAHMDGSTTTTTSPVNGPDPHVVAYAARRRDLGAFVRRVAAAAGLPDEASVVQCSTIEQ